MTQSGSLFTEQLDQWRSLVERLAPLADDVDRAGALIADRLIAGSKVLTCGNGGSACDALHLAEEVLGRYHDDRPPLPAVCLSSDATYLTCVANDYGFDAVFERATRGLGRKGDILVGLSMSGNSENVLRAFDAAQEIGVTTIGLLGGDGGKAKDRCDHAIIVPDHNRSPRVQEAHTLIIHTWCEAIDQRFREKG